MLNEELLDEKDKKIIQLISTINRYKKHDQKRSKYVRELEDKYYKLLGTIDEYSDAQKLVERNKQLSHQVDILNKKLMISKDKKLLDKLTTDQLKLGNSIISYKTQIKNLEAKLKNYKRVRDELIYQLNNK